MNFTNQIDKLVKSSEENPLKSEFIKTWLSENWQLYLDTVDNNSCTNRQSNFPCFCCIRKDDCLFVDIYNKLSIIETFDSLNKICEKQLDYYKTIKSDISQVEMWLKQNINLGIKQLNNFSERKLIRRSFINGKDKIINEFEYIIIYVSLNEFEYNSEFKKLFNNLFFEKKLLENEYLEYMQTIETEI